MCTMDVPKAIFNLAILLPKLVSEYQAINDESNYYHQVCPRDVSTNIENQSALKP